MGAEIEGGWEGMKEYVETASKGKRLITKPSSLHDLINSILYYTISVHTVYLLCSFKLTLGLSQ